MQKYPGARARTPVSGAIGAGARQAGASAAGAPFPGAPDAEALFAGRSAAR